MTLVFTGALILAIAHHLTFLLMVAFFSYYMTVRGYRVLYLKNLTAGQRPTWIDWIITSSSGTFILFLFAWGAYQLFYWRVWEWELLGWYLVRLEDLFFLGISKTSFVPLRKRCIGGSRTLPAWEAATFRQSPLLLLSTYKSSNSIGCCGSFRHLLAGCLLEGQFASTNSSLGGS